MELNLAITSKNFTISGIDHMSTSSKKSTTITLQSRINSFQCVIECLIIDQIAELPVQYFDLNNWNFPKHIALADPTFNVPAPVDLLLGTGLFWKVLKCQTMKLKNLDSKNYDINFGWL